MWIVEALDKVKEGATGLSRCWEAVAVQQLTLQKFIAVPYGSHGRADTSSATTLAKGNVFAIPDRGILNHKSCV